jgi:hypothetical protein
MTLYTPELGALSPATRASAVIPHYLIIIITRSADCFWNSNPGLLPEIDLTLTTVLWTVSPDTEQGLPQHLKEDGGGCCWAHGTYRSKLSPSKTGFLELAHLQDTSD